jgi:hypothetical protein
MGLIVSAKPIATAGMFGPARLGFLLIAMLLIDGVLAAKRFNFLGATIVSGSTAFPNDP